MRKLHRKNSQQGFTLIELLLYVTIFSTMIGAITALVVLTTSQKVSTQVTADINYQGEAAMAYITQTVHQASSITTPAQANASGSLTLAMPTSSVNPTVFSAFNDGTTTRLKVNEGNPGTANYLTNSRAVVSNLNFTNMSLSGSKGSVMIRFTLTYRTTSQRQEFTYAKTFYGAATIP